MIKPSSATAIGIDLGGTKIKAAIVSPSGAIEAERHMLAEAQRGPDPIIADIIAMVRELDPSGQLPIGIGVAGQVDKNSGVVRFAPNLKWHEVPLRKNLEQALHQSVSVINDVRAHTWGEWLFGAGQGCDDLVCLFIGTGVGGGVVSGGHMVEGFSNVAGELGHMIVDPRGPLCACGNRGCLEAWVSGIHLEAQARLLARTEPEAGKRLLALADNNPDKITPRILEQALEEGDPLSQRIIDSATEALIIGVVNIVHAYNPQAILLGGGVIKGFPHLVDAVRDGVQKHALKAAGERLEVLEAKLGNDAAIVGAAAVAAGAR